MGWSWKWSWRNNSDDVTVSAELKIGGCCEICAKKIQKAVNKVKGVEECVTDLYNNKIMVAGKFDLEKVLKIVNKIIGKKAEILEMAKKSDIVETEDDESDIVDRYEQEIVAKTNEESGIVQRNEENPEREENDNNPETSIMVVEFKIPFLCDKYEVYIGKVISKFEGVKTCVVDLENKRVVVSGDFDQEKMLKKLKKKMRKEKDEESTIAHAEKVEEIEMSKVMFVRPDNDGEKEIA